jgi:hypothetical protein
MSNCCVNKLTVKHKDPSIIERIVNAFNRGELYDEFIPCPKELLNDRSPSKRAARKFTERYGAASRNDWRLINWGTEWDSGGGDGDELVRRNPISIRLTIITAYCAPIHVLDYWVDLGCDVRGTFLDEFPVKRAYLNKRLWEGGIEVDRVKRFEETVCKFRGDPIVLPILKAMLGIRTSGAASQITTS